VPDDVLADDEDLMDLQAMDAWDAENERRLTQRKEGGRVEGKDDQSEESEVEDDEKGEGEVSHRKDSMDHGGLAEALGRARAMHSIGLSPFVHDKTGEGRRAEAAQTK
jgi:hypothetical protein